MRELVRFRFHSLPYVTRHLLITFSRPTNFDFGVEASSMKALLAINFANTVAIFSDDT